MRFEYKYLVNINKLDELRSSLIPFLNIDKFALFLPQNEYIVRSIYYDTHGLKFYHEKVDGLKIRNKIRIRGYNKYDCENVVFLEVKRKKNEAGTKNRAMLYIDDIDYILKTNDLEPVKTNYKIEDIKKFLFFYHKLRLSPASLVTYNREPFQSKTDPELRITFDKNIRYMPNPSLYDLYEDKKLINILNGFFVLEIKTSKGYPEWLRNTICKFDLMRTSVSKYTLAVDNSFSKRNYRFNNLSPIKINSQSSKRQLKLKELVY
jgi:VTC domain.